MTEISLASLEGVLVVANRVEGFRDLKLKFGVSSGRVGPPFDYLAMASGRIERGSPDFIVYDGKIIATDPTVFIGRLGGFCRILKAAKIQKNPRSKRQQPALILGPQRVLDGVKSTQGLGRSPDLAQILHEKQTERRLMLLGHP